MKDSNNMNDTESQLAVASSNSYFVKNVFQIIVSRATPSEVLGNVWIDDLIS